MRTRLWMIAAGAVALGIVMWAPAASAAPVSVGQSGWLWGNPTPQGLTLNDVQFSGARGYAVGNFGAVLRSDDGGGSWIGLPSGTENNLGLVQEVDPNTIVVGGGCTVRESTDAGASFHRMPVNESETGCATGVASFSFLSGSMGYVENTDGSIFLTRDGGQTVEPKTRVPLNGSSAGQIVFVSPTVGFALASGASGHIYRTADGAGSWTLVASSAPLAGITFVTPTTAYAVGANSTLLQSTDEGKTWKALALALPSGTPPLSLTQISCSDVMHCLIATAPAGGGNSNVLVRTTDGGANGALVSASEQNLLSVAFSTASSAVAVGEGGATVLSSDGGATFPTLISHKLGVSLASIIRIGEAPQDAYVPGVAGQIAASTNGGVSWSVLRVPTSAPLVDVAFPAPEIGYAVNSDGTVYRSATGGLTWSILSSGGVAPTAMIALSPTTVLLTGPRGVRRSTDSGASFRSVETTVVLSRGRSRVRRAKLSSFDLSGGAQVAGPAIVAYGKDVLESTDGGGHWTLIQRPLAKQAVSAVSFVDAHTGYESSAGRLFFTHDAGRHWHELLSLGTAAVAGAGHLSFSSARDGYALAKPAGAGDVLLRTEDGGRSWTPEILPAALSSVTAAGPVDYATSAGDAFFTNDGGLHLTPSSLTLSLAGPHRLTRSKLNRARNKAVLNGQLTPAAGGEQVTVSWSAASGGWHSRAVTVSASGAFSLTVSGVRASTVFVAQWLGDGPETGAGTPAVQLTVTRK